MRHGTRVRRMRWLLVSGLAAALLGSASAGATLPQRPVRTTTAYEIEPAGAPGALAWAQASRSRPNAFAVFARRGGSTFRVSRSGRRAFVWGGAIDGTRLVYSEFGGPTANLWFFDLVTKQRSSPPPGVNSPVSENGASRSGDWLLFRRTRFSTSTERIVLRNVVTDEERLLATAVGSKYAQPGNVAGDYATWIRCPTFRTCRAFLYRISTETTTAVPNPNRRSQYAVSTTPAGTVYFAESTNIDCGVGRRLLRFRAGVRRLLVIFGPRQDPAVTSPVLNANGSTTVFYDRFNCRTGASNLYKVVDPS
jgi:hypothetical protein